MTIRSTDRFGRSKTEEPQFISTLAHHASDPFRLMVESVRDYAIFMLDPAGNIASWNPGAEQMKGYKADEIIGKHLSILYTPADVARGHPQEVLRSAFAEGRYTEEGQRVRKDGSLFWAKITLTALRDHFGQHVGFAKVTQDISSRKAIEDSLRSNHDLYRRLLEMMPEGVLVSADGMIAFCNSAFTRLMGASGSAELFGTPILDVFAEDYHDAIRERIETTKREGFVPVLEEEIVRRDGTRVPVEVAATLIRYEEREAVLLCLHDLTVRHQVEETAFKLASIVEGNDNAIIGMNLDGTITSWNPAAEQQYGYSSTEILGKGVVVMVPSDRLDEFMRIMEKTAQGENTPSFETMLLRKDAKPVDVSVTFSPVRDRSGRVFATSIIAQDITENKRLQEQFRQAQKMEAIGRLAGGVAHDFNNLLTVILGNSEELLASLPANDQNRALIAEISKAGERAASLTRRLLTFSRKQVLEPKVLYLNAIVAESEKLLVRLLGEDIEVKTKLTARLGLVKADPAQLEQVIMNLSINARDAMPQGGKLTIETAEVELDDAYCRTRPQVKPGPYIMLAVSDSGTGMDEVTKSQIFEPFFTTKEQGKGTGLGLSMVYSFIMHSGGHLAVYSEPGMGSTFKVYLPQMQEALAIRNTSPGLILMPKGNETVLLEARNGKEAILLAEGFAGPIHLLATDVVMPYMGGQLVAERVVAIKPDVKVLLLSGYTGEAVIRNGVLPAKTEFLQKPFTPSSLAKRVREVLDKP
jgi:PAS domain S-box-containing protein